MMVEVRSLHKHTIEFRQSDLFFRHVMLLEIFGIDDIAHIVLSHLDFNDLCEIPKVTKESNSGAIGAITWKAKSCVSARSAFTS